MNARTILAMILVLYFCLSGHADTFKYTFKSKPLAEALADMADEHPEVKIIFIYDQLEKYRTSADVDSDDPYRALRLAIGINPVSVTFKDGTYYCEALQKGAYTISGNVTGTDSRPVEYATVMLLSPKDSTVMTFGTTDAHGRFYIPCDRKNVIVKLTSLGYVPTFKSCRDADAGTIVMAEHAVRLKEIKVEAQDAFLYSDKSVFIPSSRQKKFSMSATDLLEHMAIPQIIVNPQAGSVTDISGSPVAIFVNGARLMDGQDKGLLTSDVKKVEYLMNPSDTRFEGERYVLNFIVSEYEFGGYTKISTDERFFGKPLAMEGIFTQFAYKKFTYDLFTGFNHAYDKDSRSNVQSSYSLRNSHGDTFIAHRDLHTDRMHSTDNNFPLSLRARYSSGNFWMYNTITYNNTHNTANKTGRVAITDEEGLSETTFFSSYTNRLNSLNYSGLFNFNLPKDYSMSITPTFRYANIRNKMGYDASDLNLIDRHARENAYRYKLSASINKRFGDHNLSLNLDYHQDIDKIIYSGTNNFVSKFNQKTASAKFNYSLYTNGWSFYASAGLAYDDNRIDRLSSSSVYPFVFASVNRSLKGNQSVGLILQHATFTPDLSEKTSGVLKDNEFLYITGNPLLKNSGFNQIQLQYSNSRFKWLRGSVFVDYSLFKDNIFQTYESFNDGAAVLRRYMNAGDFSHSRLGANLSSRLLNGKLSITATPTLSYYHTSVTQDLNYLAFSVYGAATWYFNRFYIQPSVKSVEKSVSRTDYAKTTNSWKYTVSFGANFGKWNLKVSVNDFIGNRRKTSTRDLVTPLYSSHITDFSRMLNIRIMASYSFSYGRKATDRNELNPVQDSSSAILK